MATEDQSIQVDAKHTQVVIVGGGMVGLCLALMLAESGVCEQISLIESHTISGSRETTQPSFDSRSTAVSSGSRRLLEQLGLWPAIAPCAEPIQTVKVSDQHQFGFCSYRAAAQSNESLGFVVDNRSFGFVLNQAVMAEPRITVYSPAEVHDLKPTAQGYQLTLQTSDSEFSLSTDLLVLADGAASPLAKKLGVAFKTHQYRQHAVIANVAHSQAHDGCAFEHFTERGPLALLPLPDDRGEHRSALVWTCPDEHVLDIQDWDDAYFLKQLQDEFGYRLGRLSRVGRRDMYSLNLVFAEEQIRRSLLLVGNAAHFLHPVAGQGFNLALRDCAELCQQLSEAKRTKQDEWHVGELSVLQQYLSKRAQDQWLTTELSHSFIALFASSNRVKRGLRTLGLSALNKAAPLKSLFFHQMMGKGIAGVNLENTNHKKMGDTEHARIKEQV